jgi:hypothetical protein
VDHYLARGRARCVLAFFRVQDLWAEAAKKAVDGLSHSVLDLAGPSGPWLRYGEVVLDGAGEIKPCFSSHESFLSDGRVSDAEREGTKAGRVDTWFCISRDVVFVQRSVDVKTKAFGYPHPHPRTRVGSK